MNVSTVPAMRYVFAAACVFLLALTLAPGLASADTLDSSSRIGVSLVKNRDAAKVTAVDDVKRCLEADPSKGDHHDQDSWQSQAEEWESAAEKHAAAKHHKEAAGAYEYAACLRLIAGQLEEAADDYDKAAEQWDEAGDKVEAQEARDAAKLIRGSMK